METISKILYFKIAPTSVTVFEIICLELFLLRKTVILFENNWRSVLNGFSHLNNSTIVYNRTNLVMRTVPNKRLENSSSRQNCSQILYVREHEAKIKPVRSVLNYKFHSHINQLWTMNTVSQDILALHNSSRKQVNFNQHFSTPK